MRAGTMSRVAGSRVVGESVEIGGRFLAIIAVAALTVVSARPAAADSGVDSSSGNGGSVQADDTEPEEDGTVDGWDRAAQSFWLEHGKQKQKELLEGGHALGLPADVQLLVHLPSGGLIYPSPSAATEGTNFQVAILVPRGHQRALELERENCNAVSSFRTTLDDTGKTSNEVELAKKMLGVDENVANSVLQAIKSGQAISSLKNLKMPVDSAKLQAFLSELTALPQEPFSLVPVGPYFRCGAGTLKYQVRIAEERGGAEKDTSEQEEVLVSAATELRIRPKYHFASIAVLGYNTASRISYGKERDGENPPTIKEEREHVGPSVYLGGMWMIGGVDYESMKWHNYFLNPFLAVNPAAPTKDVAAGLAITPTGGLSLALALTLHQGRKLVGYEEGQPFSGDGDIPTRDSWADVKPGVLAGLAIDSRVYDALVKSLGGK